MRDAMPVPVAGYISIWELRAGVWRPVSRHRNTILAPQGRRLLADIASGAMPPLNVGVVGTDGTAASSGQTGIIAEAGRGLVGAPGGTTPPNANYRTDDTDTIMVSFSGISESIREAGLYSVVGPPGSPGDGIAVNRGVIGPYNPMGATFAVKFELVFS